ncbi:MAG: viral A-type inclusion protein [Chitinophagaceae bacterium]|nr:viral A-type inclusion protein [Chitinophagaceae bacterium]
MKTKEDSLFQEVMDGHDAAMARMGRLAGLRKEATKKADSLARIKTPAQEKLITSLRMVAENLQASENKMNAWMEGFSIDSAKNDKDKRIAYLESEKLKVNAVKDEVLGTVAVADSLLKK